MSTSVVLPALGESVTEGTVTRWLKKVGDTVEADEGLLEISTDKVDTEIPSPVSGVIEEILVQEDETADVGAELAVIGDGSGAGAAPAAAAPQEAAAAEAPALVAAVLGAAVPELQRGAGTWQAEWAPLLRLLATTVAAAEALAASLGGLQVDVVALARHLDEEDR